MDLAARRGLLVTRSNPDARLDYVVALEGHVVHPGQSEPTRVGVRYVPDKLILESAAFGRYLKALGGEPWPSLEDVAAVILDDVNNEVVPRWAQITVSAPGDVHPGIDSHGVILEDRQPRWDNPALLSRLKKY